MRNSMNRREMVALSLASLSTTFSPASPQSRYPERPIRLLVPFSAGGVVDAVARQWAERVKPHLGTIVIENQGGAGGTGTMTQLAGELFKQMIGAPEITHVPYRGAGPSIADLVAGQIPMATINLTGQTVELHRSGKIRILAVTAPERLKGVPEIPTA